MFMRSLPVVGLCTRDGIFGELASLHFLPISMWSFDHMLWRSSSANFQFFFEEYCPIYSCRVGVSQGKASS